MTRRLSAFRSSRTFRLHVSPHPAFDRMRFLFTMSEIEGQKTRRRIEILFAGRLAFVTLSALALNETDKSYRKDRKRLSSARHPSTPQGANLGGARRDRTDDLMLAKHALSQLSYGPEGKRSSQPIKVVAPRQTWWAWEDLNLRPHAYQARALTN